MTPVARFWSKVTVLGPEDCWLWQGSRRGGYGRFRFRRQVMNAHRFAWESKFGPLPEGLNVLHRCDCPPCCNPSHLFLGTHQDNMNDRGSKGRSASVRGAANGNARMSEAQALEAIALRSAGDSFQSIADRFGVTHQTIRNITSGSTWPHLTRKVS
jgi:HNH endonuclease